MKNKKGSQVGVVLSFIIFITFIFFIYLITQPALKVEQQDSSLEYLTDNLIERASSNLTTVSVGITQQNPESCVRLSGFFSATGLGNRIIVNDNSGNALQSSIDTGDLFVVRNGNTFFKVQESSEFNVASSGATSPCQQLTEGSGYSFGIVKAGKDVFQARILSLIQNYTGDYEALKKQLKIPEGKEFDFSFTYGNGTKISTNKNWTISSSINVYAKDVSIEYISKNASKESGSINVKLW